MIDGLEEFKLKDTTTFDLEFPTGMLAVAPNGEIDAEGKPILEQMTMTVMRMSSAKVQKFVNARSNVQIGRIKAASKVTAESLADDAISLLTFCVIAWTGFRSNGSPLECNKLNVRNLLADDTLVWVKDQVNRAVGDETAFLGNDSTR